jgi:hypothetical protein
MAQITEALRREFGPLIAGRVPAETLAAISDEELADRLHQARSLVRKSQAAASLADRKRLTEQARAILAARPRDEVERVVVGKMAKAAVMADPGEAARLRAQARELLQHEPPAVRRRRSTGVAVAKADPGSGGLVAIYNGEGVLIGVCPADSITPVSDTAAVAKAVRRGPARPARR